jgi:hypothetical protein
VPNPQLGIVVLTLGLFENHFKPEFLVCIFIFLAIPDIRVASTISSYYNLKAKLVSKPPSLKSRLRSDLMCDSM